MHGALLTEAWRLWRAIVVLRLPWQPACSTQQLCRIGMRGDQSSAARPSRADTAADRRATRRRRCAGWPAFSCALRNTSRWSISPSTASTSIAHRPHSPRRQSDSVCDAGVVQRVEQAAVGRHLDVAGRGAAPRTQKALRRRSGRCCRRSRSAGRRRRGRRAPRRAAPRRAAAPGRRLASGRRRGSAAISASRSMRSPRRVDEGLQALAERRAQRVGGRPARRRCARRRACAAAAPRAGQQSAPCRRSGVMPMPPATSRYGRRGQGELEMVVRLADRQPVAGRQPPHGARAAAARRPARLTAMR